MSTLSFFFPQIINCRVKEQYFHEDPCWDLAQYTKKSSQAHPNRAERIMSISSGSIYPSPNSTPYTTDSKHTRCWNQKKAAVEKLRQTIPYCHVVWLSESISQQRVFNISKPWSTPIMSLSKHKKLST
eukprot:gene3320-6571_t